MQAMLVMSSNYERKKVMGEKSEENRIGFWGL